MGNLDLNFEKSTTPCYNEVTECRLQGSKVS
jgi:hypothetical protein